VGAGPLTSDTGSPAVTTESLGPFLTVVSTSPEPGSHFTTPPSSMTLTFDRPIDPTSLGSDLVLNKLGNDGSLTNIFGNGAPPTESLDASGAQLTVSFAQILAPGHYQIDLFAFSGLTGLDGSMLNTTGADQVLADFYVDAANPVSPAGAKDLGTAGAQPLQASDSLDFRSNPEAVQLYKVTLPEGGPWLLGAEVRAQRDGSPLDAALALFTSDGRALKTSEFGRKDFPADPYLFADLPAGTYLLGVSGLGNLPGLPGGYDPSSGAAGSIAQTQPGGPYTLQVVATPYRATTLLGLRPDYADPLDPAPTGFTLGFSGALGVNPARTPLSQSLDQAVQVVDQNGRSWTVMAVGYNESTAQVSYLFTQSLPPGSYVVRLRPQGGLVDLAGVAPTAPNMPPGVLGSLTVPESLALGARNDLGTLLPESAEAGVTVNFTLGAYRALTERFVIPVAGYYAFRADPSGGPIHFTVTGQHNETVSNAFSFPGEGGENLTYLTPGVYHVALVALGRQPVQARLTIALVGFSPESFLQNGLGQGPALNLELIAPTSFSLGTPPANTPAGSAAQPLLSARTETGGLDPSVGWATLGAPAWVGQPAGGASHVTPVGAEATALAALDTSSAPAGADANPAVAVPGPWIGQRSRVTSARGRREPPSVGAATDGAIVSDAAISGSQLSELEGYRANLIDQIAAAFLKGVDPMVAPSALTGTIADSEMPSNPAPARGVTTTRGGVETTDDAQGIEGAALTSPLSAGVVAVLFVRYRHTLERWVNRLRGQRALSTMRVPRAARLKSRSFASRANVPPSRLSRVS
jgi:hypothetical protein